MFFIVAETGPVNGLSGGYERRSISIEKVASPTGFEPVLPA
jgi:hypothetical protein